MTRALRLAVASLLVAGGTAAMLATPADAETSTETAITVVSEAGDPVGNGSTYEWHEPTTDVVVTGSPESGVYIRLEGGADDEFDFSFAAPPGQTLQVGTYDDAQRTPFREEGHPGIDVDGWSGCNRSTGRFTVLDMAPDLSRLWIIFEHRCEYEPSALFGEIRYNEPDTDGGDLLLVPHRVDWPDTFSTATGRSVPVVLTNTGPAPITVNGASLAGPNAEDFRITNVGCDTIAVGEDCATDVVFVPREGGDLSAQLVLDTSSGIVTTDLSGHAFPGRTGWSIVDEHAYGPASTHYVATAADKAEFTETDIPGAVALTSTARKRSWLARFRAPAGQQLTAGTTYEAGPFTGTAGPEAQMYVGEDFYDTCEKRNGTFTVLNATYDEAGDLESIAVRFDQVCRETRTHLSGYLGWQVPAAEWPTWPSEAGAPEAVSNLRATPFGGERSKVQIAWDESASPDWATTVVRQTTGTTPAPGPTRGTAVFDGRRGAFNVYVSQRDYTTFTAFPVDYDGNVGAPVSLTLRPTATALRGGRIKFEFGQRAEVRGRVTDAVSGEGVAGVAVALLSKSKGSWTAVGSGTTGPDGRVTARTWSRPSRNAFYKLRFEGGGELVKSDSDAPYIGVVPKVAVRADRRRGPVGTTFDFLTRVGPNQAGHKVWIEYFAGGRWRSIVGGRLSEDSTILFRIEVGSPGTFRFRVVAPQTPRLLQGTSRPVYVEVGRGRHHPRSTVAAPLSAIHGTALSRDDAELARSDP